MMVVVVLIYEITRNFPRDLKPYLREFFEGIAQGDDRVKNK